MTQTILLETKKGTEVKKTKQICQQNQYNRLSSQ